MIELVDYLLRILLSVVAYAQKRTFKISLALCFQKFEAHSSLH